MATTPRNPCNGLYLTRYETYVDRNLTVRLSVFAIERRPMGDRIEPLLWHLLTFCDVYSVPVYADCSRMLWMANTIIK